jgi:methyl halide transferase
MDELNAERWENRYQEGTDAWDLGCPAPPFIDLLVSGQKLELGRMAVVGCGAGHDALLFAEAGFEVVGFDFAPSPIDRARNRAAARGLKAEFLQCNIFELLPEFHQEFDYVLEHTCFCAIDPGLRSQYVQVIKGLLRPGGKLIGLFFTHDRDGGPPFGVKPSEVLDYFGLDFEKLVFEPAQNSIAKRQGEEHLGIFGVRSI